MVTDGKQIRRRGDKLAMLWEYWCSKAGDWSLPGRRDIDPVDLPRHLSTLLLIDGCGGRTAPRYRFRLVGTGLSRLMVRDPTAQYLDEVFDDTEMAAVGEVLTPVAGQGRPARVAGRLIWSSGWGLPADWLFLPLASDGRTVDMILGYADLPPVPLGLPAGRPALTFAGLRPAASETGGRDAATEPGWLAPVMMRNMAG